MTPENNPQFHSERPLAGKVFLVTGASRGIGAATAVELARRGADIIGPHRDPGKNPRAEEVVRQVAELGRRMISPIADVTLPEHRVRLVGQIIDEFSKIDGMVFCHAGGMEKDLMTADPEYHQKVNGSSKLYLFQGAALRDALQRNSVLIDVPSLWSTFFLTGIDQLSQYAPVAEGKKQGEQLLRIATRAYNQAYQDIGKHVKFGSVCGHAVEGTITTRLLRRMYPELMQKIEKTAEGGKLPTIADMANAIVGMADGDFPDEDIVFVGTPQIRRGKMAEALPMYSSETRYVDRLIRFDNNRSFGWYRVKDKDIRYHFDRESGSIDTFMGSRAILDVTNNHTTGHFIPDFGISVLPGHKMVAAATEIAGLDALNRSYGEIFDPRLVKIEGISFKIPVLPGDRLWIKVHNQNASLGIGGTEVTTVRGLKFEDREPGIKEGMGPDRLIEAAAQTLGLAYLHSRDIRDVLPLFRGVNGPVDFSRDVYPGEQLQMEAILANAEDKKGFTGDVIIRADDEIVARVLGIDCRLFPARGLRRVINLGRMQLG